MLIRMYFNSWAEPAKRWSFDHGTQETEQQVAHIEARGMNLRTGFDAGVVPGDTTRPRVWMESDDMQGVKVIAGVAHVVGLGC